MSAGKNEEFQVIQDKVSHLLRRLLFYTTYGVCWDFDWLTARDCRCFIPTAMLNSAASPMILYQIIFIQCKHLEVVVRVLGYN